MNNVTFMCIPQYYQTEYYVSTVIIVCYYAKYTSIYCIKHDRLSKRSQINIKYELFPEKDNISKAIRPVYYTPPSMILFSFSICMIFSSFVNYPNLKMTFHLLLLFIFMIPSYHLQFSCQVCIEPCIITHSNVY